jgi:hypothetical protein
MADFMGRSSINDGYSVVILSAMITGGLVHLLSGKHRKSIKKLLNIAKL